MILKVINQDLINQDLINQANSEIKRNKNIISFLLNDLEMGNIVDFHVKTDQKGNVKKNLQRIFDAFGIHFTH